MGKGEGSISIIGGADGPTSIFIAGKSDKVKLTTRIQNYFRKLKSNRVKKRITANPHTLEEVVELMKREYGAEEVSQHSFNYQEQRKYTIPYIERILREGMPLVIEKVMRVVTKETGSLIC